MNPTTAANDGRWSFRLYINGHSPRSTVFTDAVTDLLEAHLPGNYTLEVVDLQRSPFRGEQDKILALPTLVRLQPAPIRKIIGDLTHGPRLIAALDLPRQRSSEAA